MTTDIPDPIVEATRIICGEPNPSLERRLKEDIVSSLCRVKPALADEFDFENDVMTGKLFPTLSAPLQGIAIAKVEGALAFYNRVGWNPDFLETPLDDHISSEGLDTLKRRYHAKTLHDLAYVHPKHLEKALGKPGAASLWETLKRLATGINPG